MSGPAEAAGESHLTRARSPEEDEEGQDTHQPHMRAGQHTQRAACNCLPLSDYAVHVS